MERLRALWRAGIEKEDSKAVSGFFVLPRPSYDDYGLSKNDPHLSASISIDAVVEYANTMVEKMR